MRLESGNAHVYLHLCVPAVLDLLVVCVSNISFSYFIYTYMSCVLALYASFHLLFHTVSTWK